MSPIDTLGYERYTLLFCCIADGGPGASMDVNIKIGPS